MQIVSNADMAEFKRLFNEDVQDTFALTTIIWRRMINPSADRFREDTNTDTTQDIELKCIVNYNYMRSWPVSGLAESGQLEEQSIQVLFVKDYLNKLGYVVDGRFDYRPDFDRFVLDGLIRKPMGDSSVSQAFDEALFYEVIMIEQATPTGEKRI